MGPGLPRQRPARVVMTSSPTNVAPDDDYFGAGSTDTAIASV